MPDKVPLWIIRNTFCSYGTRLPKRPPTMSEDLKICNTCQKELYSYKDWAWCDGEYYCQTCIIEARKADRQKWANTYGRAVPRVNDQIGFEYMEGSCKIPKSEHEVPDGNLRENDYVFWVGNTERYQGGAKSLRAQCRACGQEVYGEHNRQAHKTAGSAFYKGCLSCAKVLMLCYQQLLRLDECLVCGIKCYGKQKWGVPLCCPNCIMHWKFDDKIVYENLEKAVMQFWVGTEQSSGGSGISESISSQTSMSTQEETTE